MTPHNQHAFQPLLLTVVSSTRASFTWVEIIQSSMTIFSGVVFKAASDKVSAIVPFSKGYTNLGSVNRM